MLQILVILVEEWFSAKLICWESSLTDFHTPETVGIWGIPISNVSSNNGITQASWGPLELWGSQQRDIRIFRIQLSAKEKQDTGRHLMQIKKYRKEI